MDFGERSPRPLGVEYFGFGSRFCSQHPTALVAQSIPSKVVLPRILGDRVSQPVLFPGNEGNFCFPEEKVVNGVQEVISFLPSFS